MKVSVPCLDEKFDSYWLAKDSVGNKTNYLNSIFPSLIFHPSILGQFFINCQELAICLF